MLNNTESVTGTDKYIKLYDEKTILLHAYFLKKQKDLAERQQYLVQGLCLLLLRPDKFSRPESRKCDYEQAARLQ